LREFIHKETNPRWNSAAFKNGRNDPVSLMITDLKSDLPTADLK